MSNHCHLNLYMTLHNTWVWLAIGHHKMQWIGYGFDLIPLKLRSGSTADADTPGVLQLVQKIKTMAKAEIKKRLSTFNIPTGSGRQICLTSAASVAVNDMRKRRAEAHKQNWWVTWEGSGKCGTSRNLRWSLKYSWSESKYNSSRCPKSSKEMTRIYQRSPGQMSRFQIGGTCHRTYA